MSRSVSRRRSSKVSRSISRRWIGLAAFAVCVWSIGAAADPGNKKRERTLIESLRLVYSVEMSGRKIGSETIVRRTYDDNTVEFVVEINAQFTADTRHDQHTFLLVEEESYFPKKFHSKKDITSGGRDITHEVIIDMFANVAVVNTRLASTTENHNFVLPTGTAFFEVGSLYPLYLPLFWYDKELGGRQRFYSFDVQRSKEGTVVLNMLEPEMVTMGDREIETMVIELDRDDYKVTMNVDENGRIVRARQAVTTYTLTETSSE